MPITEKPSFLKMLDDIAERIQSDSIGELRQQVIANPSVVSKFIEASNVFEAVAMSVAKEYLKKPRIEIV